ncbi:flagellar hook-basal body complex protein FliE [Thalassobacillus sp. CUG 92003]|uniref:flagellar hook-basal body complex protein FliE n=1 Tax=Thalassobacillus sp. CUG 92003 TaxID=2736641 RepID=UPI0015E6BF7F|nr:flagellar hook-basal body complex protein FliE [Thalassobacillus sp. CUG 92003]
MENLGNIQQLQSAGNMKSQLNQKSTPAETHSQFAKSLKNAIDKVNESQIQSDQKTKALANGETNDLHDVMISAQKASVTLQTTVEMQRKAIDAYKEMMRMQV